MQKFIVKLSGFYILTVGVIVLLAMAFGLLSSGNLINDPSFLGAVFVYLIFLVLWPALTGVGIILHKNWARYLVFVMSVFAIFIGISSTVSLIFIPQSIYGMQAKTTSDIADFFFTVANFIFFIGIPIYFMIFFNKKSVKALFGVKKAEITTKKRPFGITLIAILSFLTALFCIVFAFMPIDSKSTLMGAIFLSDTWNKVYFLSIGVINLYIAIGFLRMDKKSWVAYIAFYIASIIIGIINSFAASKMTFFEIVPSIQTSYREIPNIIYKFSGVIGLVLPTFILMYVVSKKRLFTKP